MWKARERKGSPTTVPGRAIRPISSDGKQDPGEPQSRAERLRSQEGRAAGSWPRERLPEQVRKAGPVAFLCVFCFRKT